MNVEKKLRECEFFLNKMREQERLAFGDREPFDFYLSAFLSAARSIHYRLRHEHPSTYPNWRTAWNAKLTSSQADLIKALVDDRNFEVHESGSKRTAKTENLIVGNFHSDASGSLLVSGPPGMSGVAIQRPAYSFSVGASDRRVTDSCQEYLSLLHQMVADFRAAHP